MDLARTLGLLLLPLLQMRASPGLAELYPTESNAEICLLPPQEGPCRALHRRYYYDRYTQRCQKFFYGGCMGNANNFPSLEACDDACWRIEKVPFICQMSLDEYQCNSTREEYFFNLSSMTCEKLMSGRCNRNNNRFPTEATCRGFCEPKRGPSFCYSPKDGGLCSANVTRYYFNPRYEVCEAFTYTGCGGNNNNFVDMKDCNRVCVRALQKEKKKMPKLSSRRRHRILRKRRP